MNTPQQPQVPAFAIFSGGGAKASVFPGCLAAAKTWNIAFQGYGGSSGGAIVAALAAAGYSATDLKEILDNLDLEKQLLDDGGNSSRN